MLAAVGMIFTACEGNGGIEEENGGNPSIPKIELSQQSIEVDFEPETYTISVTSPYYWKAESDNDWIVVESEKGDAGTEELSFKVERNEEENERKGSVFIYNSPYNLVAELNVIQKPFAPAITIEKKDLSFSSSGGEEFVKITTNFDYDVTTNADWVKCSNQTKEGITIKILASYITSERTADIVISNEKYNISKTVKVTQTGLSEEDYAKLFIVYTSSDEKVVTPHNTNVFGANIVSNIYENGKGVIKFDAPVTKIGNGAFRYCSNLTSVTIPDSVKSIEYEAFEDCSSLTSVTIGNGVTSIEWNAFWRCSSLTSITIPDSVTSIGEDAFYGCYNMISITIGNSVTSIGNQAFYNCSGLASVTIPDSVTSIGNQAFYNCSGLASVTIPDSVTSIGDYTFYKCSSLTSITILDSVTSIGLSAFFGCSSLTTVYCKATTPPSGSNNMFYNNASGRKIYVPTASVSAYKSARYWSGYASDIVGYDF